MQNIKETIIPLLKEESSTIIKGENGITTITFYRGDKEQASKVIRSRFKEIVNGNTWLVGRLIKNGKHKNIQLAYPSAPISDDVIDRIFFDSPANIKIGSETAYEELFKSAKPAIVEKGGKLINKQGLVSRLTLVPDMHSGGKGFALIFSISHVVADGYTYYKIFNQLFTDKSVESLEVKRKQDAADRVTEIVGKKSFKFFHSAPFILNLVGGAIFGKKTKSYGFYIEPERINKVKTQIKENSGSGVDYISTNDILSSSFAKVTNSRICIMAVNLRSWIKDIRNDDAGNYAGGLLFDNHTSYHPVNIRKSFQAELPVPANAKPLPKFWEALRCKLGLISSWADFQESHDLEKCEQLFHIPLYDAKNAFPLDSAVVFKAKPDQLAVIYFTKTVEREKFLSHCEVGDSISSRTFH
ncbi:hypothetical protein ATO12_04940 [Aquimarina atlantica]|uniref:Condensation domain-containing protein n=1 Tax=Aquimarina atlantica TaxID=1317122 RepID=A0A023BPI2_9FLAO|nr:hypothetical protein [Aquimarina atlantica]EZH71967.1 hypothetical protein ATO12_04940 [Aquimarina atlantica]